MSNRLMIAVPTHDYIHADFMVSLLKLIDELRRQGVAYKVEPVIGTLVYIARNRLACMAINEGFTHLLFLDSDMVFEPDIVEALTFSGKDVVCGAFQSRRPPYGSCIFTSMNPVERVEDYGVEPFRVAGCGMACTLISAEILKTVQNHYGNCFTPTPEFGEDLAFCDRARRMGAEIWCEPTARVGHIAHKAIWPGEAREG